MAIPKHLLPYQYNPVAFVHDFIRFPRGEAPTLYQEECLDAVPNKRRVAVIGPHGLGKTSMAAWLVIWMVETSMDCKVPTTASSWRQLAKFLWPEIHKWASLLDFDKLGHKPYDAHQLLSLSLKPRDGVEAFAVASDKAALIEGAHARRILYLFDESKAIPAATWDAAEGAFSTAGAVRTDGVVDVEDFHPDEAYAFAISTPGDTSGRFFDIMTRKPGYEDWWTRHVELEEAIAAGRISREWAEARLRQWGENSPMYQNRVLGKFATSNSDTVVIPYDWIELANDRWRTWKEDGGELPPVMTSIGGDVGRGGDASVLAPRFGEIIPEVQEVKGRDTMKVVTAVLLWLAYGGMAMIDVQGIGAGVVDRLKQLGKKVFGFNASFKVEWKDISDELEALNLRAAAWWHLRERLDPLNGYEVCLPPHEKLTVELSAPSWKLSVAGGKLQVQSKDEVREILGHSTDYADAVVMAFASDIVKLENPFLTMIRIKLDMKRKKEQEEKEQSQNADQSI